MKKFTPLLALAALAISSIASGQQLTPTQVGGNPTASTPTGPERLLATQNGTVVNILPTQLGTYFQTSGLIYQLLPTPLTNGWCLANNGIAILWQFCGIGTVTSVGLTVPPWLAVANSPITGSGTLAVTAATGQTAGEVLASPALTSGAVSLRALVATDVPPVNLAGAGNGGVFGVTPIANGGTGTQTPGLVAGANITITGNWPNQTINAGGGGASFPSCVTNQLYYAASSGTTATCLTLGTNLSITSGILNATAGGAGVSTVTGDGSLITNSGSTGGVTLTLGNTGLAYGVWGSISGSSGAPAYHSLSSFPAAAFPTLNQNTTGTSANITSSSNSTLTTLSALSLSSSQVTGLSALATLTPGAGVATFLATPTATNLGSAVTGAGLIAGTNVTITGAWPNQTITASATGATAFSALTSSTNTTAAMLVGTGASLGPTGSGTITATAAPLGGITGLGTGVATALGDNVGSAGAFITYNGAAGTPSAINLANATFPASISAITTLSGLTSANSSTIPASAGTLAGSTGAFTLNDCLKVGSVSPLEIEDNGSACGSGGGMVYPGAGIPVSTGSAWSTSITPGTGVATALGVNVGSAGAFVVNGGALGTPSSGVATNLTGTASALNIGGNAATATNLSSYPTLCSGGQFSQGLSSGSNNCATPTGGGNVSTSGSPAQYETSAFASGTSIEGIGPGTAGQAYVSGGASAYPSFSSTLSDVTSVNGTTIPASASLAALGTANTWAAAQTFPSSDILVKGSSTGTTAIASANSSTSSYTDTLPAATGTIPLLSLAQTWSAVQTFGTDISIGGVTPSGATGTGNLVFGTSPTLTTPALGTPSALVCTNCTGLPPTTGISGWPANASGVLTNNGSGTLSWGSAGSGTVTDGSGTTTANGMLASTTTAHVYSVVTLAPTLSISSGVLGETAPTRTVTSSPTVASTDMGGLINSNVSGGGTLTIPAISSSIFASGMTLTVVNYSASTEAVSTTPTVNSGGGCVTGTGIPSGDAWWMTSNGTTIDCIQTTSASSGGSGTVTTTGSPASTYLAGFSGTTSITGTANATLSAGALTLGVSGTLGSIKMGNATSGTVTLVPATGALGTVTASLPANTGTIAETNFAQTFTAAQTFTNSDLLLLGSSTGYTTFTSANSSASNYTATVPANTGTLAELNLAQTFSAAQTFSSTVNGSTIPTSAGTLAGSTGAFTSGDCLKVGATSPLEIQDNGSACGSGGSGTVTDGSGTSTANELLASTTTAHAYSVVATLPTAAMPALTGDVTNSAGSLATTVNAIKGIAVAVATASSSTSVTPNCTNAFTKVTASATGTFTINAPGTCTPFDGQKLELKIISPSGGTITYSWNATYLASATLALPTTSNAASKEDYFEFQYDADKSGWVYLASNQGF